MTKKVRIIYRESGKGREIGKEKENEGMESMIAGERGRKRKGGREREGEVGREKEGEGGREREGETDREPKGVGREREGEREREREGGREVQPKSANAFSELHTRRQSSTPSLLSSPATKVRFTL
jgi:hypothetical protein